MKPTENTLRLLLKLVWYFFVIFIVTKYTKKINNLIQFSYLVIIIFFIGSEIIEWL